MSMCSPMRNFSLHRGVTNPHRFLHQPHLLFRLCSCWVYHTQYLRHHARQTLFYMQNHDPFGAKHARSGQKRCQTTRFGQILQVQHSHLPVYRSRKILRLQRVRSHKEYPNIPRFTHRLPSHRRLR